MDEAGETFWGVGRCVLVPTVGAFPRPAVPRAPLYRPPTIVGLLCYPDSIPVTASAAEHSVTVTCGDLLLGLTVPSVRVLTSVVAITRCIDTVACVRRASAVSLLRPCSVRAQVPMATVSVICCCGVVLTSLEQLKPHYDEAHKRGLTRTRTARSLAVLVAHYDFLSWCRVGIKASTDSDAQQLVGRSS